MTTFSLIAFLVIAVFALFFLAALALAIYAFLQLNKTAKKMDRIDALEQEVKKLREEVNVFRGTPPTP